MRGNGSHYFEIYCIVHITVMQDVQVSSCRIDYVQWIHCSTWFPPTWLLHVLRLFEVDIYVCDRVLTYAISFHINSKYHNGFCYCNVCLC